MNQRHLKYFLEIYEQKSIKGAAAALMISVQGLSRTLIALEEELGEELFVRSPKGLVPTDAANILKNHAQRILEEYKLIQSKEYLSSKKKRLKIISSTDIMQYLTVAFIKEFHLAYPNLLLVLVETTDRSARQMILDEEIEIAIIAGPLPNELFSYTHILTSNYVTMVHESHPLAKEEHIEFEDLDGIPIAIRGQEFSMFDTHQMFFDEHGVNFNTIIETSSYHLIHSMVEENLCIGSSLDYIAYADKRPGTVIIPHGNEQMCKHILAAWKKNHKLSAEAKLFYEFLMAWIQ